MIIAKQTPNANFFLIKSFAGRDWKLAHSGLFKFFRLDVHVASGFNVKFYLKCRPHLLLLANTSKYSMATLAVHIINLRWLRLPSEIFERFHHREFWNRFLNIRKCLYSFEWTWEEPNCEMISNSWQASTFVWPQLIAEHVKIPIIGPFVFALNSWNESWEHIERSMHTIIDF